MNFASDNWAGAAPEVMSALSRFNEGFEPAYGKDALSEGVAQRFNEIFEREVAVYFVATGTAANALAVANYARPGGAIFCHQNSHLRIDECNSPEFMTSGNKLVGVGGAGGKMTRSALATEMSAFPEGVVHYGQVAALSISQVTESGTVYSLEEVSALSELAKSRRIPFHMDGARFANALVSLDCSPAELTWKAGVDVLSFGGTKNGCWCAEAVVFFNPDDAQQFEYYRKRGGHLFSKSRFVAAQFEGYFADNNWLKYAAHANQVATRLAEGIQDLGGRLAWPSEANEVFPILSRQQFERVSNAGAKLYEWPISDPADENIPGPDEVRLRMVASFATKASDVDAFLSCLAD